MKVKIDIAFEYKGFHGVSSCEKDIREAGNIAKQALSNIQFFKDEIDGKKPVKKVDSATEHDDGLNTKTTEELLAMLDEPRR